VGAHQQRIRAEERRIEAYVGEWQRRIGVESMIPTRGGE
jgi:hypothetical protein